MNIQEIQSKWEKYLKDENIPVLKFNYTHAREANVISLALQFWNFIKKNDCINARYHSDAWNNVILQFLSQFTEHSDILIATIARLSSFPDHIFRVLLWEMNIDFQSLESCLRRLSDEQIVAIKQTHDEMFYAKITPKIVANRFGNKNLDKIFAKAENNTRYHTKGSWVNNYGNLDFGFDQYPNGPDDDTKIFKNSPLHFISMNRGEEHNTYFVVNTDYGKYWKMYRAVLSNYVFCPNKEVTLGNKICPGFWRTMPMHLWFWIVSPICFLYLLLSSPGHWFTTYPIAALTPLWCILALIKRFILPEERWDKIEDALNDLEDKIKDKKEKHRQQIELIKFIIFVILLTTAVIFIVATIFINRKKLWQFIVIVCDAIYYFFATISWLSIALILPIAGFFFLKQIDKMNKTQQEKICRIMDSSSKYMFWISLVGLALSIFFTSRIFISAALLTTILYLTLNIASEKQLYNTTDLAYTTSQINNRYDFTLHNKFHGAYIINNQWLKNMDVEKRFDVVQRIFYWLMNIVNKKNLIFIYDDLFPYVDERIYDAIINFGNENHRPLDIKVARRAIQKIVAGLTWQAALAEAEKEIAIEKAKTEKTIKILKIILFPIVWLWHLIKLIGKGIVNIADFVIDIGFLIKHFLTKACPFVEKSRPIE